jgi:ABC-type glycerol-3-phosphate transport system permease component
MAGSQIIAWNFQMAGSLLAAMATLLVYIFLGRYFLRSFFISIHHRAGKPATREGR